MKSAGWADEVAGDSAGTVLAAASKLWSGREQGEQPADCLLTTVFGTQTQCLTVSASPGYWVPGSKRISQHVHPGVRKNHHLSPRSYI